MPRRRTPENSERSDASLQIGEVKGGIQGTIVAARDAIGNTINNFLEDRILRRARDALLPRVEAEISNELDNYLTHSEFIELEVVSRKSSGKDSDRALHFGYVAKAFNELNKSLLILGQPGSGKSTTLLMFAQGRVLMAKHDRDEPIPVKLNLSAWRSIRENENTFKEFIYQKIERIPLLGPSAVRLLKKVARRRRPLSKQELFHAWLVNQFKIIFDLSEKYVQPLIHNDYLVLLLDGLDELSAELRAECVEAINLFQKQNSEMQLAISCRTDDYQDLSIKPDVDEVIELQPLSVDQINKHLKKVGSEYDGIRKALRQDSKLQELASTPLMLSTIMLSFEGKSIDDLDLQGEGGNSRELLFDEYVKRMFAHRSTATSYEFTQTVFWLGWLAHRMHLYSQTQFVVDQLSEDWLISSGLIRTYYLATTLAQWSIVGLALGLMGGLLIGLVETLYLWLFLGFLLGLMCGIVHWSFLFTPFIFIGFLVKNQSDFAFAPQKNVAGSTVALAPRVPFTLGGHYRRQLPGKEIGRWLAAGFITWILGGWLIWYFLNQDEVQQTALVLLSIGGMIYLLAMLQIIAESGVVNILILKFFLYGRGFIPWNYEEFLQFAADRILLIRVGRVYKFRHELLLRYFADKYDQELKKEV